MRFAEPQPQRVQQPPQLGLVDLTIAVAVDVVEAVTQRISRHVRTLRRFLARTNCALVFGAVQAVLPALEAPWIEHLGQGADTTVVTPPVGATAPQPLVLAVHGAGDRPEWACGGWRLASQVSAFVACPRGSHSGAERFAWASSKQLVERVEAAIIKTRARFGAYVSEGPMIYAGFSQGATLAGPLLRAHADRFPIAILAEGGYQISKSSSFARAFREKGGRRIVLVCGTPSCFQSARVASSVLTAAGVEVLVVGDEKAGHNLNERMQRALHGAWPAITAPLKPEAEH